MRRSPLRRVSKRRKSGRDGVEFPPDVRADVYERADFRCEVCRIEPILHLHHRHIRSAGGKGTLANALGCCWADHQKIHDNPRWAYAKGYLLHSAPISAGEAE